MSVTISIDFAVMASPPSTYGCTTDILKAKTNAKDNEQNENDWEHVSAKTPRDKARNMPINYITFNQDNSVLGLGTCDSS